MGEGWEGLRANDGSDGLGSCEAHHVGVGSKAHQCRTKIALGAGPEWIEASSGTRFGSCETKNLSRRQKENRGGTAGKMGEAEGGEEINSKTRQRPRIGGPTSV